jgi:hypothetical protein
MHDTYDSAAKSELDRAQQRRFLAALNGWDRALRRDECGCWCILGRTGRIYTAKFDSWLIFISCHSRRAWTAVKARLAFCQLRVDGDEEGILKLHLPTPEQADAIRYVLGLRKRMEFTPDDLERRRASVSRLSPALGSGEPIAQVLESQPKPAPILEPEL